jgi:hypothetical protein
VVRAQSKIVRLIFFLFKTLVAASISRGAIIRCQFFGLFAEETIRLVHSDSLVLQTLSFANLLQRSNLDSQYYWWIGGLFTCYFFFKTFVASMILGTEQRQENFADICCDSKIICVNKFTKKNYTFMESKNSPLGPSIKFTPRPLKSLSRPFLEQPRL